MHAFILFLSFFQYISWQIFSSKFWYRLQQLDQKHIYVCSLLFLSELRQMVGKDQKMMSNLPTCLQRNCIYAYFSFRFLLKLRRTLLVININIQQLRSQSVTMLNLTAGSCRCNSEQRPTGAEEERGTDIGYFNSTSLLNVRSVMHSLVPCSFSCY